MNELLTWEDLRCEALDLEIKVDVQGGHIFFHPCGSGQHGHFEVNLAGYQKASMWLATLRQTIDVCDQLRRKELPQRRLMEMRYLWRR